MGIYFKLEPTPNRFQMEEVRLRNISKKKMEEMQNIAAHYGVSVAQLIKMEIGKMLDGYPDYIKNKKHDRD